MQNKKLAYKARNKKEELIMPEKEYIERSATLKDKFRINVMTIAYNEQIKSLELTGKEEKGKVYSNNVMSNLIQEGMVITAEDNELEI